MPKIIFMHAHFVRGRTDICNTVKPLNNGHIGIFLSVLCSEVVRFSEGRVVLCACTIMH